MPDEKLERAVVTLLLEYFDQSSSTVEVAKRQFFWQYNQKSKSWEVDTRSPFGD
jgi:hypothetical protein